MPGYDYEEFDRKQAEWEASHQNNHEDGAGGDHVGGDHEDIAW